MKPLELVQQVTTATKVVVNSPGKINLTLEVLFKRPDNFHEIRSVLLPVSLYDTVEVSPRNDGVITCYTVGEGVDVSCFDTMSCGRNLATRAAKLMQHLCDVSEGCDIKITKRIPIGAGMAGGSADAVGTMHALREMWAPDLTLFDMIEAASLIGSDIPALLHGGAVLMEGRGERITGIEMPYNPAPEPFWLVIVFPGFSVCTKEIYENCRPGLTCADDLCKNAISSVRNGDVRAACSWVFNGLQDTVFKLYPEAERFCLALRKGGAMSSLLSGSGSAVFGLAENMEHALAIQRSLPENVWSRVVSTLPDGVTAAHGPLTP
jgi:4-diphosphocytidyl-2-C-methyl-D-erythritol kinase